jgi:hypothetical protein
LGATGLALALVAAANAQNYVKWDQPPDPAQPDNLYYGWNEESTFWDQGPTVADDWVCQTDDPVVGIRWWGSFLGWQSSEPPQLPAHFHILFWTDVPADPGDPSSFSHPGQVIHEIICFDYQVHFVGWDFDPKIGEYEACFLFEQTFLPAEYFYQDPTGGDPGIYWVSISACYDLAPPPPHPWGWKTRPRDSTSPAPDDAVVIDQPTLPGLGSVYISGQPIEYPVGTSWDTAFDLIAQQEVSGIKWDQPPVLNPDSQYPDCFWGWDEVSDYRMISGQMVADDWVCMDDRPVTDVHWWGSYLGWDGSEAPDPPMGFYIGVWTDVPAGEDDWFSHPGELLQLWYAPYDTVMEMPVGCDWHPDFMPVPETCFYYTFNIPEAEWFYQQPGPTVYWLSIAAHYVNPVTHPWGWKTRPRDPTSPAPDDAVRIFDPPAPPVGAFYQQGEPIFWPTPDESWDTAFQLTTEDGDPYIKWSQPPEPYVPDDAFNGWDEHSVYSDNSPQIVGDDWVCRNEDPISDVHWWGSFIGWGHQDPPVLPDSFHIGIWEDIPADPDDPNSFSHPGDMIWENVCNEYNWQFVGWDFDPRDPFAAPEACYYFECDIPPDNWFYQPGGTNIYWVTIAAIYDDECLCNGDLDDNGVIDAADFAILMSCYGLPPTGTCVRSDLDCDGDIDDDDVDIFNCQAAAGWPDPNCCPDGTVIMYPFGVKTRPRSDASQAPDDAVRVFDPTTPIPGDAYVDGEPLWWPTPQDSWDIAFRLTATHEQEPGLVPKWAQEAACFDGFDAESNLWWAGDPPFPKWDQPPDVNWPGIHSDNTILLADDWRCQGGVVTDLHWYGNYENEVVGVGLAGFNLWIYADAPGMPAGPPAPALWSAWVPFTTANETDTGLLNSEGCRIFRYDHFLSDPFDQVQGNIYWLVVQAVPNAGDPVPIWRWQEAGRNLPPILNPAMIMTAGAGWLPICWTDQTCTDFAFVVTSDSLVQDVNKVVADDFISDGRDILALGWFGSYFDDRYMPDSGDLVHVIDGWLIGIHWADINAAPNHPPELILDGHPTVLAVYFAPASAVEILGLYCTDCNGHPLFHYRVDLDQCCLVCTHPDPRNTYPTPGLPGVFQELTEYRYWLSVQAVTGIEWTPDACDPVLTGHLPPLEPGSTGAFWGWHTGYEPPDWAGLTYVSALGAIVDFTPYPPGCWDYGTWVDQPWECPTEPIPVHQAFALMASDCPEDLDGSGAIDLPDLADLLSRYGSCVGDAAYSPAADFDNDGCVNLPDLAQLLSVYGQICPTW